MRIAPIWLLWHTLWIGFVAWLAAEFAIGALTQLFGLHPGATALALWLPNLIIAFEASELRRRKLIRGHVAALFNKGRKAGLIRKDIPLYLLIEILLGVVESVMVPSKVSELGLTLEKGYSTIIRVILEGAFVRRSRP